MSPQRHEAIRYLSAELRKYREQLKIWQGAGAFLKLGVLPGQVTTKLKALIEDAVQLLRRLKGKPLTGEEAGQDDRPDAGRAVG